MSGDGIGAELARQIGHGLNNVHAALLEQQRASARDRSATLTKIDALSDKMEARFADLEVKIVDVCDRGGREHKSFDDRLDAVERRMDTQEAYRAGRDQTRKVFADATTWTQAPNTPSGGFTTGGHFAGYRVTGEIAEIVTCSTALGATDRSNLHSYLRTKWGTP